jgi:hypothetical protein
LTGFSISKFGDSGGGYSVPLKPFLTQKRGVVVLELVDLKYTRKSYSIRDINVQAAMADCRCSSQFHIRTAKMLLCLTLVETPEPPSVVCDLINGHKSVEDDAEKLVCESKYNDKTFQSHYNVRLTYAKQ